MSGINIRQLVWVSAGAYGALVGSLLRHSSRVEVWGLGGLFFVVFCYRQWELKGWAEGNSVDWSAIAPGLGIGAWLLYKAWGFSNDEAFLRCLPLLSLLSWGLICFGWQSLKLFRAGFVLFGFLALPWEVVYGFVDLSLLTAQFSHWLLWVMGLEAERIGTLIRLGTGSIEVYHGCSGLKLMLQLVGFSLIYLVLNGKEWRAGLSLIFGAIAIGFGLNSLRVAIMTILVSLGDEQAFDYWHLGDGSLIFSAIAVVCLGGWGWLLLRCFEETKNGVKV
ncbi:MAG: archaeosortase/exosortase family protein [Limnothrix sp.]